MAEITAHHGLLRDTTLHVDDTGGTGRPVVLIHGWPLSGEAFADNVPALQAAGYRVVTYDRRGFGRSDTPRGGYDYDTLSDDLQAVLTEPRPARRHARRLLDGRRRGRAPRHPARARAGAQRRLRLRRPPFLATSDDNPDGPLDDATAAGMESGLTADRDAFFEQFTTDFFSVDGTLAVTEEQRRQAVALAQQSDQHAALACMEAFATTDFRDDLPAVRVPTLVLHGDGDAVVPFEGSGARTAASITGARTHVVAGGPHGVNVSHADERNRVLIEFLAV
ncbi:arylesterase [Angustibacter aerolatus]|uniref:Arylesterase n=1 Tax=Angustibacter aerolatus TaxID=1162965 RepID=A0ABQ6JCC8_9ACTN|nr:alpha/beta hydrolase [Angustibacter aerolatus]GMA85845.1 arylesterase [Angustibacter aerolatus]